MTDETGYGVLTDAQWAELAPLIEQCRPAHKTQHANLRRTIEAIVWRHDNGAKWRGIPPHLGPWWMAAQTFNRWSRHGVWERLLHRAQQREGIKLGMAFLDGSTIRAHQKAAGAAKKRLSWLSSIVPVFDNLTRRAPAQGWRAAPAPSAAATLIHPASYQLGF
jgi:transposase